MQVVNTTMNVPFVDLKAQYQSIKPEVDAAIAAVLEETAFVGGPRVKAFEDAFAQYCGVARTCGSTSRFLVRSGHGRRSSRW